MSLIPVTRDELKQLKIQADEEKRRVEEEKKKKTIETKINNVYSTVINAAKVESCTKYLVAISNQSPHASSHYQFVDARQFGDFFTPFRNEDAQSVSQFSPITAPKGGVLNKKRCNTFPIDTRVPLVYIEDDIMPFVLSGLQELFPDSKVTVMACAPDGKMYDISTVVSPFIHPHTLKAFVVDWS